METNSPGWMSSEISCRTVISSSPTGNDLTIFFNSTIVFLLPLPFLEIIYYLFNQLLARDALALFSMYKRNYTHLYKSCQDIVQKT